jgi:gluconate 5-dehydrogenase
MLDIFSLNGRVALVTGSSRGLGWIIAKSLAQAGAHVVLNGRDRALLDRRLVELNDLGLNGSAIDGDIRDDKVAEGLIEAVERDQGRLDILLNNAAYGVPKGAFETSDAEWQEVLGIALTQCYRLSRKAAPIMARHNWGRIVMVSSVNARIGRGTNTAYIAAKAGLEGLTRALGAEFAPLGICVNAIAPGYMITDGPQPLRKDPKMHDWLAGRSPLKRWGRSDELAGIAVYLASDACSFCIGQVITVDGGMSVVI